MNTQVIQNWTLSQVPSKFGSNRSVVYKVVKSGAKLFQEIRDVERNLIQTLELPSKVPLEKSCFEVLLRYALADSVDRGIQ